MKTLSKTSLWAGLLGLCLAAPAAWAQDNNSNPDAMGQSSMHDSMSQKSMHHMKGNVMGAHTMPAVVDTVDTTTGLVTVTSEQMQLKVHFPPASVRNLKAGDHITLHLAFSK